MRLSDFSTLTFDCYGTLIDWEAGIVTALRVWLAARGAEKSANEILEAFANAESSQQRETPAMLYPNILAHAMRRRLTRRRSAILSSIGRHSPTRRRLWRD